MLWYFQPFLFSFGDATNKERRQKVYLTDAIAHLMRYYVKIDHHTTYPFINHSCCMFWGKILVRGTEYIGNGMSFYNPPHGRREHDIR